LSVTERAVGTAVGELLVAAARTWPDRPCIIAGDEHRSYSDLLDAAHRLAAGLHGLGVDEGDRVALVLHNSQEFVTSFFAVALLGGTVVPLDPRAKEAELRFYVTESGASVVIVERAAAATVSRVARMATRDVLVVAAADRDITGTLALGALMAGGSSQHPDVPPEGSVCTYQYSPGSTGRPKGVPRTHRQVVAEARSVVQTIGIEPNDVVYGDIPLYHAYGLGCCLLAVVGSGAALVLPDTHQPFVLRRSRVLETLEQRHVTIFPGVPLYFRVLAESRKRADLGALRLVFSAGAALPLPTFQAFHARFGVAVRQLYGTTETGAITANLDDDAVASATTVGTPLGAVEVEVTDDDGAPVAGGRIGEVVVSSPAMTSGYNASEAENDAAFRDGWFLTGDRGRIDDHGRLQLTGRRKLLIDVVGDKVDPVEVEDVLATHPRVREVVVVGVPAATDGEQRIKAVVVGEGACTERELVRYCSERLASYKVPDLVEFVDEIPRSTVGEVLRSRLVA
jgi:long-chain acyl-CoA synthetase